MGIEYVDCFTQNPAINRQSFRRSCSLHAIKITYSIILQDSYFIGWLKKLQRRLVQHIMSYQASEEHIVLSFPGKIQCQVWLLHAVVQFQWSKRRGFGPSSVVCHTEWQKQIDPAQLLIYWPSVMPLCNHRMALKLQACRSSHQE